VHYYQRDLALIHDRGYGLRQLTLPGDPLPPADAVVSVGHVLSYLPDAAAIEKALTAAAGALRPGGVSAASAAGGARRAGVRRDVVRGRGTPGRPAFGDRPQGLVPNGPGACSPRQGGRHCDD
jgi:hypothetical protein